MTGNLHFVKGRVLAAALIAAAAIPTVAGFAIAETTTPESDKSIANETESLVKNESLDFGALTTSANVKTNTKQTITVNQLPPAGEEAIELDVTSTAEALPEAAEVTGFREGLPKSEAPKSEELSDAADSSAIAPEVEVIAPSSPLAAPASASLLESLQPASTTAQDLLAQEPSSPSEVFQDIRPGSVTRSGYSYVGIGGNIGIIRGASAAGDGSFVILSKIGLNRYLSVRPSIFFGRDVSLMVPLTYDFSIKGEIVEGYPIAPFIGAGLAFTFDDDVLSGLVTAGIDVPVTRNLTATVSTNFTVFNEFALGVLIGIGYNFVGF